jgi:hypothetical protein
LAAGRLGGRVSDAKSFVFGFEAMAFSGSTSPHSKPIISPHPKTSFAPSGTTEPIEGSALARGG